jgi:transposase
MHCQTSAVILLSTSEEEELKHISQARSEEIRIIERASIVLLAAKGIPNNQIGHLLGISRSTAMRWRNRYRERREAHPEQPLRSRLLDEPRPGAPDRITPEQYVDLLALSTQEPRTLGVECTHWSSRELARYAEEKKIVRLHRSTVSRFLKNCRLQPHRVQEWMNRKDDPDFEKRATEVKRILAEAVAESADPQHAVLSYDEKTGIQALERIAPDKPMQAERPVKREYEYKRHGTLSLLALMVVTAGTVMGALKTDRTNSTTAEVLAEFFTQLLAQGSRRITVVLDQLNTHMSLEVVLKVAALCHLPPPELTLIATMEQRRIWLEQPDKAIVFLFTPKHASWLNPIELWFGVLSRKIIRRGSFKSTNDLQERVEKFIAYYNEKLAHPYRLRHLKSDKKAA